jgi:eukaryotic-like serine/threonine-protein kinase
MPAFISRDVTPKLCEAVRRDRFVLLVGESTSGKTRAAYEAIRTQFPDYRLIHPAGREAIPAAVQVARETTPSVLWLDDLERFLGADGLTGAAVNGILTLPDRTRCVLATMRAEEYAKYAGRPGHDDNPGREAVRRGWEVLRLATRLTVPRAWSSDELGRAAEHRHDPRVREALDHSDRFGVAEYLAAGPQLFADWEDAWAPGTHPRAAALVLAAVDARRVGMHRPLQLTMLERLHGHYLQQRGGQLLRPESLEDALAWATMPLHATSSLLLPADDGRYLAVDYLIDAIDKHPISPEVLSALLVGATPEEAMEIGEMSWGWHLLTTAEDAFHHAQDAGHVLGIVRRCHLIRERDGSAGGLQFARQVLADH